MKTETIDLNYLSQRYADGYGRAWLAKDMGVSERTIRNALKNTAMMLMPIGQKRMCPARRINLNATQIAERHMAGQSVASLAKTFGVSRATIVLRLHSLGLIQRGRIEANRILSKSRTVEQRRAYAVAANKARRMARIGIELRSEPYHRQAISASAHRNRKIGQGEAELIKLLESRNIEIDAQRPLYGYNIDIAIGNIAVEVWWGNGYPLRSRRQLTRIVNIANLGWHTIYVWLCNQLPVESTADAIISFIQFTDGLPSSIGAQYRVIRSSGEIVSTGKADLDHISIVPSSGNSA